MEELMGFFLEMAYKIRSTHFGIISEFPQLFYHKAQVWVLGSSLKSHT